jgi:hypothetical protein
MTNMKYATLVGLVIVAGVATTRAQTPAAPPAQLDATAHAIDGVRDARYCELIPIVRDGLYFVATIYNTLGHNDCPAATWRAITDAEMKKHFGAVEVLLNGPRHFLMDSIIAGGATAAGATIEVGGLAMTERATINLSLSDLRHEPYRATTVARDTRYRFKAGRPIFLLQAPDGSRFVMQAYAQIVDKTLTYADLPGLGARLKLPRGWRYVTSVPGEDLIVGASGEAVVVQDELQNTYQKLE